MNSEFQIYLDSLEPKFQLLMKMQPVTYSNLPKEMPERGIYLFSENGEHLYVGRSNKIRNRLLIHRWKSSNHNKAAFAFRIARKHTGMLNATYTKKDSRASLEKKKRFCNAFSKAKERINKMDLRFVEETDPIRQALLEMYISVVLKTEFNDFDNH